MKKVFMTLAVVLMGVTAANAQFVLGGTVGIGGSVGSSQYRDGVLINKSTNQFNLTIAPKFGYLFNEGKMEAGLMLNLGYTDIIGFGKLNMYGSSPSFSSSPVLNAKNHKAAVQTGSINNLSLTVTPYYRYFFLQKGIFSLGIQAHLGLGGSFYIAPTMKAFKGQVEDYSVLQHEYVYEDVELTKDQAKEANKELKEDYKNYDQSYFNYGIYVIPVMRFDLSEHCYMDITLNSIGLYAAGAVSSYKDTGIDSETFNVTKKTSSFTGGFTGFSQGNAVSIGFAYKF